MPAHLVAKKFREGRLHSGSKHGPIVTNPAQKTAIQISEARAEGHHIPYPDGKKRKRKSSRKRSSK